MVKDSRSYRDWPTLSQIERDTGVNRQVVRALIIEHDVPHVNRPPAIYVPPHGMMKLSPILREYKRKLDKMAGLAPVA